MPYKTEKVRQEFRDAPVILQMVGEEFKAISRSFGVDPVMTRVKERVKGSSGVHEAYRGLDFRDEQRAEGKSTFMYTKEQANAICQFINAKFPRNDGKLTCIHHSFKGKEIHFHLQLPVYIKQLSRI